MISLLCFAALCGGTFGVVWLIGVYVSNAPIGLPALLPDNELGLTTDAELNAKFAALERAQEEPRTPMLKYRFRPCLLCKRTTVHNADGCMPCVADYSCGPDAPYRPGQGPFRDIRRQEINGVPIERFKARAVENDWLIAQRARDAYYDEMQRINTELVYRSGLE